MSEPTTAYSICIDVLPYSTYGESCVRAKLDFYQFHKRPECQLEFIKSNRDSGGICMTHKAGLMVQYDD